MEFSNNEIKAKQEALSLNIVDYNLNEVWNSHWLIGSLRKDINPLVELKLKSADIPFDPQDLEHQVLFFLTTYSPGKITHKIIEEVVEQQYLVIRDRLLKAMTKDELEYLFRGLKPFYPDLNTLYRLKIENRADKIFATGDGRCFEVEFKKIDDPRIISCFTGSLHYIHQERIEGDTFALFFKGDQYPWAIETTEKSTNSRQYKRNTLLAYGINPDKAVELTRLYTLPGSPLNAISLLDKLVKKYYQENSDVEALFTCTMPSYSKSKSTTIAGGINNVLCIKEALHYFIQKNIDEKVCWEAVTKRWIDKSKDESIEFRKTDQDFKLLPVIDVFMPIKKLKTEPLPVLKDGKKVIFYKQNEQI